MFIVIERGDIFEGSLEEFNEFFETDPPVEDEEGILVFCEKEGWGVKLYEKASDWWN